MNHSELSELYDLYVLGVLEPEKASELERHLAEDCAECREGIQKAFALSSLLGTVPDLVDPPKRLRRRVLASVGVESKISPLWLGGLAFVSTCLAITLVLVSLQSKRWKGEVAQTRAELRLTETDRARSRAALEFLNAPETKQVGFGGGQPLPPRGHVAVNANRGVLLMAANLPPAPLGKAYEMWLVPKQGAPVPAGLFQPDRDGNVLFLRPAAVDVGNTKAVAVTLEPEKGSSAPTSTPLIAAGLAE